MPARPCHLDSGAASRGCFPISRRIEAWPRGAGRPSIKIILVSGRIQLSDMDGPAQTRFFGKPLQVKQMIVELQQMVGRRCTEDHS
jgi:hypothetical protein